MKVYDIPVLFQVRDTHENAAADRLAYALGHSEFIHADNGIESWFLPNHKDVDGNDIPITIQFVVDEEKMAERQAIVDAIKRTVGIE